MSFDVVFFLPSFLFFVGCSFLDVCFGSSFSFLILWIYHCVSFRNKLSQALWVKTKMYSLIISGVGNSNWRCQPGSLSLQELSGRILPLAAARSCKRPLACGRIAPVSASIFTRDFCSLCVCALCVWQRYIMAVGAHLDGPGWFCPEIFNWIILQRPFFWISSHS